MVRLWLVQGYRIRLKLFPWTIFQSSVHAFRAADGGSLAWTIAPWPPHDLRGRSEREEARVMHQGDDTRYDLVIFGPNPLGARGHHHARAVSRWLSAVVLETGVTCIVIVVRRSRVHLNNSSQYLGHNLFSSPIKKPHFSSPDIVCPLTTIATVISQHIYFLPLIPILNTSSKHIFSTHLLKTSSQHIGIFSTHLHTSNHHTARASIFEHYNQFKPKYSAVKTKTPCTL